MSQKLLEVYKPISKTSINIPLGRVVMYVFSQGMMFKIPTNTLLYLLLAGLVEMLAIGLVFGLTLESN